MTKREHQDASCEGCADFSRSRRRLMQSMAALAGAGAITSSAGGVVRQLAFAGNGGRGNGNVLVVLSLRGGADGLSMIVPHGDPSYRRARPRIAVPTGSLLARDGMFGLHPSFDPLLPMWRAGKLAAVHAVGTPQPNRSHFAAMEEVEDADPGSSARVGWLNRLVGLSGAGIPDQATQIGSSMVPTSLYGPAEVMAFRSINSVVLPGGTGSFATWKRRSLTALAQGDNGPLGRGGRAALEATRSLGSVPGHSTPQHGAVYPKTPLGDTLADTVRLLRARLGIGVVTLDYGSWDMHVNIGTPQNGAMRSMVDELARGLAAFYKDLGGLGDNVTVVTISEFGRRVTENGNVGADHGYGNAMLVAGAGVRGGRYYGRWPGLGPSKLIDGDLAVTRDYRSVLAEVLAQRFNPNMSAVFPGFRPESPLGLMRG